MDGIAETPVNKSAPPLQNGRVSPGQPDIRGSSDGTAQAVASLDDQIAEEWGFHVDDLYRMALTFFKG